MVESFNQYLKILVETIKEENGKWIIYSKDGTKKLGVFDSKEQALKRL